MIQIITPVKNPIDIIPVKKNDSRFNPICLFAPSFEVLSLKDLEDVIECPGDYD